MLRWSLSLAPASCSSTQYDYPEPWANCAPSLWANSQATQENSLHCPWYRFCRSPYLKCLVWMMCSLSHKTRNCSPLAYQKYFRPDHPFRPPMLFAWEIPEINAINAGEYTTELSWHGFMPIDPAANHWATEPFTPLKLIAGLPRVHGGWAEHKSIVLQVWRKEHLTYISVYTYESKSF